MRRKTKKILFDFFGRSSKIICIFHNCNAFAKTFKAARFPFFSFFHQPLEKQNRMFLSLLISVGKQPK